MSTSQEDKYKTYDISFINVLDSMEIDKRACRHVVGNMIIYLLFHFRAP